MKNILIISSSPNSDGLTDACVRQAEEGIKKAGLDATCISLNAMQIAHCKACGNGWGICRTQHTCCIEDDFHVLQKQIDAADACIVISPVYWGETSEISKCFFDRLRRCEASKYFAPQSQKSNISVLSEKEVIIIATAGGSGNGTLTCLMEMERLFKTLRAKIFDRIPVTRFNRAYKLDAIRDAAFACAKTVKGQLS